MALLAPVFFLTVLLASSSYGQRQRRPPAPEGPIETVKIQENFNLHQVRGQGNMGFPFPQHRGHRVSSLLTCHTYPWVWPSSGSRVACVIATASAEAAGMINQPGLLQ